MKVKLFLAILLLAATGLAIYSLYYPATSGSLFYDDYNSLNPLAHISDLSSAVDFVTSGNTGPLGRPIALASFLPHAADWPNAGSAILNTNILIHIFNAFLLGLMGWLILRQRDIAPERAFYIALAAALFWAVMPLNASASLIAIQRMTTLATTFMLLGLVGYVYGFSLRAHRPYVAFFVQFGSLGTGALLGLFTKEIAILTPVYALLLETLLLRRHCLPRPLHIIAKALLWIPLLIILWYLVPLRFDWFAQHSFRDWSSWERIQFQVVMLWEYLRLAAAPLPSVFSPFHDWRTISDFSTTQTLTATAGWLLMLMGGLWAYRRFDNPWPLFALLWFLVGHLLESTSIALELVFEHRNYLATFGLALGLAMLAAHAPGRLTRIAPALFGVYLAIQAGALFALTTLWGDPGRSSILWANQHLNSSRAALHAAIIATAQDGAHVSSLNEKRIVIVKKQRALEILDRRISLCDDCTDVRMQALLHACAMMPTEDIARRFDQLAGLLTQQGDLSVAIVDGFYPLQALVADGRCGNIAQNDVIRLIAGIKHRADEHPELMTRILFVAAKAQSEINDWQAAIETLNEAEALAPAAVPILQFQVYIYQKIDRPDLALAAIARREKFLNQEKHITPELLESLRNQVFYQSNG